MIEIGKNKLEGFFRLENTGQGTISLLFGQEGTKWLGCIGTEPLKDINGNEVIRKDLETILSNVPDGCLLMPSQIYSRIIINAQLRDGIKPIYYKMCEESRSKHQLSIINNLFVLNPFNKDNKGLFTKELITKLEQDENSKNYKDFQGTVFLTYIKYDEEHKIDAKYFSFCHLFFTGRISQSDYTSNVLRDPEHKQDARKILTLAHGIRKVEKRLGLGIDTERNEITITGNGPVFQVYRKTKETTEKHQVLIDGDKLKYLPEAKSWIIKPIDYRQFKRQGYQKLL
jgi:hypothetical protein